MIEFHNKFNPDCYLNRYIRMDVTVVIYMIFYPVHPQSCQEKKYAK